MVLFLLNSFPTQLCLTAVSKCREFPKTLSRYRSKT